MATAGRSQALPQSCADAHGRLLPETPEQRTDRSARMRAALAWIEAQPATPEGDASYREVLRGVHEGRPHRKLFEGMYRSMARIVVLDTTPLGLLCGVVGRPAPDQCRAWVATLDDAGWIVVIPEIADYD